RRRCKAVRAEIAPKNRMRAADMIVQLADAVLRAEAVQRAVMNGSAFVLRRPVAVGQHLQSRRAELRWRNLIVHERRSQRDLSAPVARRRRNLREISSEHGGRWNVVRSGNRRGALDRELCSAEEEQLVVKNGSSQRSAKLVPLQRIADGRKEIACV